MPSFFITRNNPLSGVVGREMLSPAGRGDRYLC
jgi:hypothetical protein